MLRFKHIFTHFHTGFSTYIMRPQVLNGRVVNEPLRNRLDNLEMALAAIREIGSR